MRAVFGFVVLAIVVGVWLQPTSRSSPPAADYFQAGELDRVSNERLAGALRSAAVIVCADRAAFAAEAKFVAAGDEIGVADLKRGGQLFTTPSPTRVRVIDHDILGGCVQVRLLDGPEKGRAGFVAENEVRRP